MKFPLPAREVVPHRGGMCCIDTLLDATSQKVIACVTLHPQHRLLNNNTTLDRSGFIELAAQAACGLKGIAGEEQTNVTALLGGVSHFQVFEDATVNQTLMIYVFISGEIAGISLLNFHIDCNECLLASGELKVFYQAEKPGGQVTP
ncbi:hypothetical protein [Erwinia persicina]|uniref:Uncharacterized protein n=2 Tax=Erwinia persicina TaxID=55211 RepID=A0ABR8ZSG0_9GAMM|nr:hypothetical protein [Erwinia persicina]MBD8106498.1 hypothetical protein [Erwinia persicina]MBD8166623.1 hypothetical protein [Erwinia persicina]MBD8209129.1 hypothetical protein [Erwinia persicina]MCQ4094504.1 hypothetical protein [Erwinia persicina]MCQ4101274.1 hypothetical protein [Erwinia persicina]